MTFSATHLEIAHRLLYQAKWLLEMPQIPADSGDWLRDIRAREIGKGEIPNAAQLAAQSRLSASMGIGSVCVSDADYPAALLDLEFPPPILFYRGSLPGQGRRRVAIVGSRRGSRAGLDFAANLGRGIAAAGLPVVSGLARGVDQAAQSACIERAESWAVLGCGLDRIYPPEAGRLAEGIVANGGLLSEFPPCCPPLPFHFPRRNRIIAALSAVTVVVEAGAKSGALSTAQAALSLGRELGVVPGSPANPSAKGSNGLLKDGATPVLSPDDVLSLMGMRIEVSAARAAWTAERCRREGVCDIETLAARMGCLLTEVLGTVAEWERLGEIKRLTGGRFEVMNSEDRTEDE